MSFDLIVATSSVSSDLAIWDTNHFRPVNANFKNTASESRGLASVGDDHLASCQNTSAKIKIWSWSKGGCIESHLPEKCLSLVSTPDGSLMFAGGKSGQIHVWQSSTGRLLHSWQAHYKAITILKMDSTGTTLITSSEDANIHLWLLPQILDPPLNSPLTPYLAWAGHTLPVKDLEVLSSLNEMIVVSVSLDSTCQVWSLVCTENLKMLMLPCPLWSVTVDRGQLSVFCGAQNGSIYESSLVKCPSDGQDFQCFGHSHSQAVTCLSTTSLSDRLISGSLDGTVKVWDLISRQCLTQVEFPGKHPISEIIILHRSPKHKDQSIGLKISNLNKFPNFSSNENDSWEWTPAVLTGQTKYKGIAREFLKEVSTVQSAKQKVQETGKKDLEMKLKLDEKAVNVNEEPKLAPETVRALVQQILQQDSKS